MKRAQKKQRLQHIVGQSESTSVRRRWCRSSAHLSDLGFLLLELTQPQDASPRLIVELLLEGVKQLHLLAKADARKHTHTHHHHQKCTCTSFFFLNKYGYLHFSTH